MVLSPAVGCLVRMAGTGTGGATPRRDAGLCQQHLMLHQAPAPSECVP
jgi:hypothetical protein